jgi:hypothetical protein
MSLQQKRDHRCKLSESQEQEVASQYLAGEGIGELANRWGYTSNGIWHMLRRLNVPLRSLSEAGKLIRAKIGPQINRTYSVREDYFARADTPEVIRWIGFIAADGCISDQGNRKQIIVQLQERDRPHLEALASTLGYDGPIAAAVHTAQRERPSYQARLCISCTRLCDDLIRHGITPRKSLTLQPWAGDPDFARFWWAGFMDGDGTLAQGRTGSCPWIASLTTASLPVAQAFAAYVAAKTDNRKEPKWGRGAWQVHYSGLNTPQAIARLFYTDLRSSTPLARKQQAASRLLSVQPKKVYRPTFRWGSITVETLEGMRDEAGAWAPVAARLGVSYGALAVKLHSLRQKG